MKKYVKPELIYERYELSQNIAACAWDVISADQYSCEAVADESIFGFPMNGNLFTTARGCHYDFEDGTEKYCYHGGAEFKNIFQS